MTDSTETDIRELGRRWSQAEQEGDVGLLDALSTEDFTAVGPLGFILDKQQWLDRYRTGALVTHSLRWEDVEIRGYGEAAIAVGCHDQRAEYQGSNVDARLRATHILIRREDGWRLAGMHLSPIGGPPPGAPRAAPTRATEGEAR